MADIKDQMIEHMEEERADLEQALDDIEAHGGGFKWCVRRALCVPSWLLIRLS